MTTAPDQVDPAPRAKPTDKLADMVAVPSGPALDRRFYLELLAKVAVLGVLFTLLNFWQFRNLARVWLSDPNWSHGFIIPLFSLFLLYNRREELLGARPRACLWALPLMMLALVGQVLAYYPISNLWLCELSMVAVLFFLVLYLGGPGVIRITWLPILYLALAMPIPGRLYVKVSLPLQEVAAQGSAMILRVFGTQIEVTASHLRILSRSRLWHDLTVAEACSGVRSLMAYVALGVAWAYLEERPLWQRVVLVISIVPVAILCNVIRVSITCAAYAVDRPELGQKFMHSFTGMLMLIPAVLMFLALSWLLKSLFVEAGQQQEGGSA